jgi:DNA polymerase III epsilon subunit-like protein
MLPLFLDTETTGLLLPQAAPLETQPYIVEICILGQDDCEPFHSLVKPPIPIPVEVSRIHGITDADVKDAPTFKQISEVISRLLIGRTVKAYNASFDQNVLRFEFMRLGRVLPPAHWHDPMHDAQMDTGKRWKQADLYAALTGQKMVNAHSALADCRALKVICETLEARREKR